uniref:Secreted protein n=1 Tax=Setaria viridis TaxID=4556 RepID=A0A4U6ULC4_SETVI|nr:hypothetical protein SEVIR_6G233600v2 [Setaria viridis]
MFGRSLLLLRAGAMLLLRCLIKLASSSKLSFLPSSIVEHIPCFLNRCDNKRTVLMISIQTTVFICLCHNKIKVYTHTIWTPRRSVFAD